ncbi:polyribonucleotide nucleotidyltransferase [Candidatus Pelagibacter sp. RS40]|uniref:polyribonucleotide nucleotidyltransferase n=1 Tax=Candidatus Pelagibacter sp. RS40 TaxID=1977865 RepID=UPI000A14C633|nr:polyribonucleotide nucleotidyltransferase [Candidatus Pelagibacter sp. RS40]ARJ49102.1 polyribonucleotide nucleotidyltransferase [Candidatus Pelagibacter sp. RS40]
MFKVVKKEIEVAGKKISLETGKIARQADGAIIAQCGETVVLATAVGAKKVNPDVDYFPLSVNYQEKYYAAGKIPGGYFKREARPTESETLISRLIDRPIRPLFPDEFKNEVQVLPTVISYDKENEADILSIIASSAALAISGMPFLGPVGASRVGFIDGKYVLNPSKVELKNSKLDLVVAGTKDAVLMVESEANGLTEEEMLNAVKFGHEGFVPVIQMIEDLAKECRKPEWVVEKKDLSEVKKKLEDEFTADLTKAFSIRDKQERSNMISEITDKAKKLYEENENYTDLDVNSQLKNLEKTIVRTDILKNKNRIDGRGLADVRPIMCEVGILPRVHGSALFTRGETQAIVTTTLGTSDDEQKIESLDGLQKERFMLHYNFPPFSVGETGRIGTGRREIGHGKLAWRAINSSLPSKESFPYTFRIVSEITESNGSSSMATVCGTSLALMDAGVPIKEPVAGIAMGLIKEGDDFSVLSDILGDEDHLGDMDFKVAGTKDGITSLQMDIKITGITFEIMEQALKQARDGRIHILDEMNKALSQSRDDVGKHTPKMEKISVDKKDIATVIGKGGATIREIVEVSGAKVDINDEGEVTVAAPDEDSRNKALQMIKDLTAKAELNKIYNGKVMKIMEFGAFVNFLGKQDGLVHISELADKRVAKVTDVVKEGDQVKVKVIGFDRGKVKLSIKQAAI